MLAKVNGPSSAEFAPYAYELVCELRRYVKKNGHFTLVDIEDHEGDRVTITV